MKNFTLSHRLEILFWSAAIPLLKTCPRLLVPMTRLAAALQPPAGAPHGLRMVGLAAAGLAMGFFLGLFAISLF